ncbi:MAG: mannose-1-phosphate guanylyltransferase/mannose-6-phosphate isomerase [Alphaproteobacteria bacterium]
MRIKPIVLSGGSGTRLWPLSRAHMPKQFLSIHEDRTLFQYCLTGLAGNSSFLPPDIICSQDHRFVVQDQIQAISVGVGNIVLEPMGRNTGPAVAIGALLAAEQDPDTVVAVLPSDTLVGDPRALHKALQEAATAAQSGTIAVLGVKPDRPETGFGYIELEEPLDDRGECYAVRSFVEKPNLEVAKRLLKTGRHLWNCGIFVFSAKQAIDAFETLAPNLIEQARKSLFSGSRSAGLVTLNESEMAKTPSVSFDNAVLERHSNLAVSELQTTWNDLGSWQSVASISETDVQGNTTIGDVISIDVSSSYLRSEGPVLAALGLKNILVVATEDSVLVTDINHTQKVRDLVSLMSKENRTEHLVARTAYRPWGHYKELDRGPGFRVKLVHVKPDGALSLQRHHHRSEHWVIVSGVAKVTRGEDVFELRQDESTFIPKMTKHRLENPSKEPLNLIEVQTGPILEESDIERFSDVYGRIG